MKSATKTRTLLAAFALATFTLAARASFAEDAKVPTTAAEHEVLAKQYTDQAAQYRKVADDHRAMAAAYKKTVATPESKSGQKNPWLSKMEKHCSQLSKDADKLAADEEKVAEYHTLRAKELSGK